MDKRWLWSTLLLLAACTPRDYPEAWPRPSADVFGCPDLAGDYDGIRSELTWLLGHNPDYQVPQRAWQEHRGTLAQAEDGSWLRLDLSLNERGLAGFRERSLRYNHDQASSTRQVEYRRGRDYECRGGWLYGLHFPQSEFAHGMRRVSLQLGRDRDGGLVAGARLRRQQSLGWGDSRGIPVWDADEIRWHRWPARPAAADQALARLQGVSLHRYEWINHGTRIPTRFTSFHLEPICLRFFDGERMSAPHGPELRRGRHDTGPEPPRCPEGWGKFDTGEVLRREMRIPSGQPERYRIEWFVLSEGMATKREIRVDDVRDLPLMPREE